MTSSRRAYLQNYSNEIIAKEYEIAALLHAEIWKQ
jgi:hypothetical protein